ncbi:MAG: type IV secretory system conjugative DNA transfer family protein [Candidatus Nitrosocaldus sp.]
MLYTSKKHTNNNTTATATNINNNNINNNHIIIGTNNTNTKFYTIDKDSIVHMLIIGETGAGKSELLKSIALQVYRHGDPIILIDPHGKLAKEMLSLLYSYHYYSSSSYHYDPPENIYYINPYTFITHSKGYTFNPLMPSNLFKEDEQATITTTIITESFISMLKRLYSDTWGPILESVLRNAILLTLELAKIDPSLCNLVTLTEIIGSAEKRTEFLIKLRDKISPELRQFWEEIFLTIYKQESTRSSLNKLDKLLKIPFIKKMLMPSSSSSSSSSPSPSIYLDISKLVIGDRRGGGEEEGGGTHQQFALLLDLSACITDDITNFIGSMMLHMLYIYLKRMLVSFDTDNDDTDDEDDNNNNNGEKNEKEEEGRKGEGEDSSSSSSKRRRKIWIFVDEAHRFNIDILKDILDTLRKVGVSAIFVTQTIANMDNLKDEIHAYFNSIVLFRSSHESIKATVGQYMNINIASSLLTKYPHHFIFYNHDLHHHHHHHYHHHHDGGGGGGKEHIGFMMVWQTPTSPPLSPSFTLNDIIDKLLTAHLLASPSPPPTPLTPLEPTATASTSPTITPTTIAPPPTPTAPTTATIAFAYPSIEPIEFMILCALKQRSMMTADEIYTSIKSMVKRLLLPPPPSQPTATPLLLLLNDNNNGAAADADGSSSSSGKKYDGDEDGREREREGGGNDDIKASILTTLEKLVRANYVERIELSAPQAPTTYRLTDLALIRFFLPIFRGRRVGKMTHINAIRTIYNRITDTYYCYCMIDTGDNYSRKVINHHHHHALVSNNSNNSNNISSRSSRSSSNNNIRYPDLLIYPPKSLTEWDLSSLIAVEVEFSTTHNPRHIINSYTKNILMGASFVIFVTKDTKDAKRINTILQDYLQQQQQQHQTTKMAGGREGSNRYTVIPYDVFVNNMYATTTNNNNTAILLEKEGREGEGEEKIEERDKEGGEEGKGEERREEENESSEILQLKEQICRVFSRFGLHTIADIKEAYRNAVLNNDKGMQAKIENLLMIHNVHIKLVKRRRGGLGWEGGEVVKMTYKAGSLRYDF